MSTYEPKHLRDNDSMKAQIKEAGRRVLYSTMSLILATSLVPAVPSASYATEANTNPQTNEDANSGQEQNAPQEERDNNTGQQSPDQEQQGQEGQQSSSQQQENPASSDEQAGQTNGNSQDTQQQGQTGSSQTSQATGGKQNGQQSQSGEADSKPAGQEEKKRDEPLVAAQNDSQSGSLLRGQGDSAPSVTSLSPTIAQGDSLAGESDTYYYGNGKPLTVTFTVTGTNLTEDFGTASLGYKLNETLSVATATSWTVNADGTEATTTVTLTGEGEYTGLSPFVTVGESTIAASLSNGTYKIVADDASISSVHLKSSGGAVYQKTAGTDFDINAEGALSAGNPTYVDATNANKIVVTVASSALDTASDNSYVKAWDYDGTQIGTSAFVKDGENYTATLTGVTGRIALEIQTKNLGAETSNNKILGGGVDPADSKIKANGALVIDNENGPVVGDFVYTDAVTSDEFTAGKVLYLGQGGVPVAVPVTDESFDASNMTFAITKDDAAYTLPSDKLAWAASTTDTHTATLTFTQVGTYSVTVSGTDALGHEATPKTEQFIICAAPTVSVVPQGGVTLKGTKDEQGHDNPRVYLKTDAVAFNVTINGKYIDRRNTTIAGITLNSIAASETKVFTVDNRTITFSEPDERVANTYRITVTYGEGAYGPGANLPVARVKNLYHGGKPNAQPVVAGDYQPFTADNHAPTVAFSTNADYVNRQNLGVTPDKILFFNREQNQGKEDSKLLYAVTDTLSPIATVQTYAADGTAQVVYRYDYESELEGNTSLKVENLPTVLREDADFTNAVRVIVTDRAGNESVWSLKDHTDARNFEGTDQEIQSPIKLVEDHTKPELEFGSLPLQYNKDDVAIPLTITERNFSYLQRFASNESPIVEIKRTNVDGTNADLTNVSEFQFPIGNGTGENDAKPVGDEADFTWQLPISISAKDDHSNDGDYRLTARLTDLANNTSEEKNMSFTIDTTAPEFTVVYNEDEAPVKKTAADGTEYCDAARTATITVNEHNFDADRFVIDWDFKNHAAGATEPTYTWDNSKTDVHTCTVTFPSDGEYVLRVSGTDKANNTAIYTPTNETQYTSPTFVIDTEDPVIADVFEHGKAPAHLSAPTVEFPEPTGRYADVNYYSHGIQMDARVMDRNFDSGSTTVYRYRNGAEAKQNVVWSLEKDRDVNGNGYQTYKTKVTYAEDGNFKTPHVNVAADHALHKSENNPKDFVVDLGAPIISVAVDKTPTSTGDGNDAKDPIQFYNTTTKLTFSMHDDHLLDSYQLEDPEGEYVVGRTTQGIRGKTDATFVVELKDGADAQNDTEYERNITLTVTDIAGNRRIWTIDRTGKVVMDKVESGSANTSINNEDIFPVALIQDTTAPVVALTGVTAGSYYNSTQTVRATVNEFNFGYLKRFDPSRVIVYVTKREGNAGRAQSTWTVPASSFDGTRPTFAFDQPFESDGHYELYAEFLDYANNKSNRASIGEFTIDKTAPTITISWDNTDARNGKYYKAGRTATITVTEHNFDPGLMSITTNGSVSGWSSNGDTHTCTVSFATDGTYNLTVGGRDMAGNEAAAITEPEFVVDLTAPKVSFGGRVQRYGVDRGKTDSSGGVVLDNQYDADISQDGGTLDAQNPDETLQDRHAYNGVVMPTIEFYDQAGNGATNYDSNGVSYTLTGGKHGEKTQDFTYSVQDGNGGQTYQFADFGLVTEAVNDGGRNVYDPNADDVYTIAAKMTDLAGNEAEGTITFSVNRYGSNYIVEAYDEGGSLITPVNQGADGVDYDLLGAAPRIQVREINVSGSESADDHSVLKEYANAVTPIDAVGENDSRRDGYVMAEGATEEVSDYGWSEYVYTIRKGNFGINSSSDSGDGGQGMYRVNVASVDRASNDTSTAEYLDTEDYEKQAGTEGNSWADPTKTMSNISKSLKNGTAFFTLDEVEPAIDELNVPNPFAFGTSYTVTAHVTDAITRGDTVEVTVDGRVLDESEFVQHGSADGTGTYEFAVPASFVPFTTHEVKVSVHDTVKGRKPTEVVSGRFMVSTLVPEVAALALVAGAIAGGVILYRKRWEVDGSGSTGTYE